MIPSIDIRSFLESSQESERIQVAKLIRDACINVGFFYVTGHGVDLTATEEIRQIALQFFQRPMEEKLEVSIQNSDHARGYQTIGQNITQYKHDWHEALDYYAPVDQNHTLIKKKISVLSGKNPYPKIPSGLSTVLDAYVASMIKLGKAIMSGISLSLGLSADYFSSYMTDPFWVIRMIGYPPLPSDHEGVSCGQHTDYGCLTILNTDGTKDALQVMSKSGDWITVDPIPGSFVINIGDMVNIWTNDLYPATLHRVVHKNTNYRISVPFFYVNRF